MIIREIWKKNFFFEYAKKNRKGPPYDFGWKIIVAKSKNSLKNQNVRSNHDERWPQKCLNMFSLSVIKKRNPPLPSWTHCSIFLRKVIYFSRAKLTFIYKEIFKIKHEILARVFLAYLCINVEVYEKCRKAWEARDFCHKKYRKLLNFWWR